MVMHVYVCVLSQVAQTLRTACCLHYAGISVKDGAIEMNALLFYYCYYISKKEEDTSMMMKYRYQYGFSFP